VQHRPAAATAIARRALASSPPAGYSDVMKASIRPTIAASAWVADSATVRADVTLGDEASVWFGAVLRGDEAPITVGPRSNVQDCAVVHVTRGYPVRIGADVTIGHGAVVHGCTIEDGALIGMGAAVLDGAVVGAGAMIAAGALVPPGMHVPAGTLAVGVPAAVRGPLTDAQAAAIRRGRDRYLERKEQYRRGEY
jgi:carbonic anhydrase/acetyltransferase-like protein (isoleucine patch superfamily)